jgi:type I restriction enzyme S subunit
MELKEGYKMTEVGIIPETWRCVNLEECLLTKPVYGIGAAASSYSNNLPTYLRITDISEDGKYIKKNQASINHPLAESYYLEEGDIVIARTGASVGKTYMYNKNDGQLVFAGFLIRIKPNIKHLHPSFFYHYSFSASYWKWVLANSMRSGQPGINGNQFRKLPVPLPPLSEQTAIAAALCDMDALIAQTEKLIEKKKAIKHGMMQQLLSPYDAEGKLKEGWVKKKLGDVAIIYTGKRNNEDKVDDGDYPFFVRSQSVEKINSYSFDGEAILVPGEGNIGNIFHYINGRFDFHQRVYKISDFNSDVLGKYIFLYLKAHFGNYALNNTVKATVDSLRLPTFTEFTLYTPSSIEDQLEIVNSIWNIDNSISLLLRKQEKQLMLKQAMMQSLLTGKIRIYKPNHEPTPQV